MTDKKIKTTENTKPATKEKKPWYKKWWVWIIIIPVCIAGFFGAFDDNSSADKKSKPAKKISVEQRIKNAITANDAFGTEATYGDKKKKTIDKFEFNKPNGFAVTRVYGSENLSNKMTRDGMWMHTAAVLKHVKPIKPVKGIIINILYPLEDQYGKTSYDVVMKITFKRETIDKINFDNFNNDNVPNIADEYWQHPALPAIK